MDEAIQISGLQHFLFCRKQWALVYVENLWEDNAKTVDGTLFHSNVDSGIEVERRGDKITVRSLPVFSSTLHMNGICDVVEFIEDSNGCYIEKFKGTYSLIPIEYKVGVAKSGDEDKIQLCAQTICLEELFSTTINYGYIYYGKTKRRVKVDFNDALRQKVLSCLSEMTNYLNKKYTPKVKYSKKCKNCSLIELCLPKTYNKNVNNYIESSLKEFEDEKAS